MKKIGIFYGSTTGTTLEVAQEIASQINVAPQDIHDVADTAPSAVGDYDVLIIGASTWGAGDLQDDMANFIDGIQSMDLEGKEVAIFGCGDDSMADTFCNSVGEIYHRLHDTHATFIAPFNNDGYSYKHSESDVHGMIVGLCIDNVNHAGDTKKRVEEWCKAVKEEIV
ncbi:MAG: flavodoxin [Bacteroides sp.]|nr:flavodoxin [Bacteroides sp.]